MTYKTPLHTRLRLAADKRRRYWTNEAERIKRINDTRGRNGLPLITSVEEAARQWLPRPRDDAGRFLPGGAL